MKFENMEKSRGGRKKKKESVSRSRRRVEEISCIHKELVQLLECTLPILIPPL